MNRAEAKAVLVQIGVAEPTDEQITTYLNSVNDETQSLRDKVDSGKKDRQKVKELEQELETLKDQNLSDVELANKEKEKALQSVADLQKQLRDISTKNSLLANGMTDEEATKIIESLNGDSFDASILGSIIKDRTEKAAADKERELLESTGNPDGGAGGGEGGESAGALYAKSFNAANFIEES